MSGSKQVAILVPSYHNETTIAQTLNSIQEQGPALDRISEVLVSEDCSGDAAPEIALSVWRSATPLRILRQAFNYGEYANVNIAVEHLPPDTVWFVMLHADDIAKPGWLQTLLDALDQVEDDVGSICSSYDCFDDSGKVVPGENDPGDRVVTIEGSTEAVSGTILRGCWWHISGSAIRVEAYRKAGGMPKLIDQKGDLDLLLRMLAQGWSVKYIPRTLMLYRNNPIGVSTLGFRRHSDIWAAMLIAGRFRWALSPSALRRFHAQHAGYLVRRILRSIVERDATRALLAISAMGGVLASYWACITDHTTQQASAVPPAVSKPKSVRLGQEP
jgi:glycosyltransferase involved in cell wall biosynthesis